MDLTPGKQRLVFVVIVLLLVGLGAYLIGHRGSGDGNAAAPSATPSTSPPSASQPSSAQAASASVPPTAVPSATPVSTAGGAEIYQWLPFTPADLAAAAKTTTTFATDYATWSYTESKAAYGAKLSGLVTAKEVTTLEYGYSTAGVAGPRAANKQVSTGSGTIDSIQSFGSGSITFVVTINQQVTSTQPANTVSGKYTVTTELAAGGWQVSDIELFGLGNN